MSSPCIYTESIPSGNVGKVMQLSANVSVIRNISVHDEDQMDFTFNVHFKHVIRFAMVIRVQISPGSGSGRKKYTVSVN